MNLIAQQVLGGVQSVFTGSFDLQEYLRNGLSDQYHFTMTTGHKLRQSLRAKIQKAVDHACPALPGVKIDFETKELEPL